MLPRNLDPKQGTSQAETARTGPAPGHASRRQVLLGGLTLGTGLVLGFRLPRPARAETIDATANATGTPINAFLQISPDNAVTVVSKHIELGQGSYSGLATILAEELDADWDQVRVISAPAEIPTYANTALGAQVTGGSTAMANSWAQLREAGASARAMLIAAAAERWSVEASEFRTERGMVHHPGSGRKASFGELANEAAEQPPPEKPQLKNPKNFELIGKKKLPRVDVPAKTDGTATFTLDLPAEITAVLARPPRFGGQVKSFDASGTKKVRGVVDVIQTPVGVAVLAKSFWAAKKGRDALEVEWDDSQAEMRGSEDLFGEFEPMLAKPGMAAREDGDVDKALAGATKTVEAKYFTPYLAHAPMETMDCVIHYTGDSCALSCGSQAQTIDQGAVAQVLGLDPSKVSIATQLAGGSFGRRATLNADVAVEASLIAKISERKVPIKLVWTREDDLRGGRYRPLFVQRLRGGLDANGQIVAWDHRLVGQSFILGTPFESAVAPDGLDRTSVEGAATLPYGIDNLRVGLQSPKVGITSLWWRSVGHTHTAFSTETFLDDLARESNRDPVDLRVELLGDRHPRLRKVLEVAADKGRWGTPLPDGVARGIALHESFSTYVCQVVEVRRGRRGLPEVDRVTCAVDCGIAINPDNVKAQMEGGIGFGLGTALYNEVVVEKGIPQVSNFNDYRVLRIHEMPKVDVHVVSSGESPTGVGEPGVPPIAPAVANAWKALTGHSVRRLPFAHPSNQNEA
ncbi:MAG: xanthine dehydrogenase family protein molybdopterin-binding subunit [Thermoanaerobaculia bacterium]|nr:xanthine dehydrogenase family protein molybdopterin-binding subunit [Thermoanaerobaculia bacterium]